MLSKVYRRTFSASKSAQDNVTQSALQTALSDANIHELHEIQKSVQNRITEILSPLLAKIQEKEKQIIYTTPGIFRLVSNQDSQNSQTRSQYTTAREITTTYTQELQPFNKLVDFEFPDFTTEIESHPFISNYNVNDDDHHNYSKALLDMLLMIMSKLFFAVGKEERNGLFKRCVTTFNMSFINILDGLNMKKLEIIDEFLITLLKKWIRTHIEKALQCLENELEKNHNQDSTLPYSQKEYINNIYAKIFSQNINEELNKYSSFKDNSIKVQQEILTGNLSSLDEEDVNIRQMGSRKMGSVVSPSIQQRAPIEDWASEYRKGDILYYINKPDGDEDSEMTLVKCKVTDTDTRQLTLEGIDDDVGFKTDVKNLNDFTTEKDLLCKRSGVGRKGSGQYKQVIKGKYIKSQHLTIYNILDGSTRYTAAYKRVRNKTGPDNIRSDS